MNLVPWRLLQWLTARFGLCWANVVSLKLYGARHLWLDSDRSVSECWRVLQPSSMCFDAHPEPYDYCGHYGADHPCFKAVLARRAKAALDREAT